MIYYSICNLKRKTNNNISGTAIPTFSASVTFDRFKT